MILTPDFVFLNNPRTGSTFARKAIKTVYALPADLRASWAPAAAEESAQELLLPINRGKGRVGRDHHGTYSQIPETHRHLPVASAVRNPFSLLVSIYELRLWMTSPLPSEVVLRELPSFPNLTFEEFLRLQHISAVHRWELPTDAHGVGPLSAHFLQMFAFSPVAAFGDVRRGAPYSRLVTHLPEMLLLRQENLRDDLRSLLTSLRPALRNDAITTLPSSHVTRRHQQWSHDTFAAKTVSQVLEREAFLFTALAERGISYTFENAHFTQGGG